MVVADSLEKRINRFDLILLGLKKTKKTKKTCFLKHLKHVLKQAMFFLNPSRDTQLFSIIYRNRSSHKNSDYQS